MRLTGWRTAGVLLDTAQTVDVTTSCMDGRADVFHEKKKKNSRRKTPRGDISSINTSHAYARA